MRPSSNLSVEKSIAVLPFVNRSADPDNEYFSDGISEEIINALTAIEGLKVIARTSSFAFKGKNMDVRTIGKQLGVATILEGSVRMSGKRVRISAQMARTDDGTYLWSKNFDRELEDIFALQDEISLLIADQIRENFGHFDIEEHLVIAQTNNVKAYNLYLQGRHHQLKWNAAGFIKAINLYEESIQVDPEFALPYFGAALSCGINASWGFMPYEESIQRADAFFKKGLQLSQDSYLGMMAYGTVEFWGKWEFAKGHHYLTKAISLNPAFTDAEETLAELYTALGEFELAKQHCQNILSLNPLSPNHYITRGNIYYLQGDYQETLKNMEAALKIDPNFAIAIELIAICFILLKDYAALLNHIRQYDQLEEPFACQALYQLMHPEEERGVDISELRSNKVHLNRASLIPWYLYLQIYLNNHQIALDMLSEEIQRKSGQFINFQNDPFLVPLYQYPAFQNLKSQVFSGGTLPNKKLEEAEKSQEKEVLSSEEVAKYLKDLEGLLAQEKIYENQDLGLKNLAKELGIHPNKLSWLINENIGKNFNEYINYFRLEAFKKKALDPANSHLTLLGLAYESGFNSKSVFNAYFKKMEGRTPSAWMRSLK